MKSTIFAAVLAVGVVLVAAGPASAQVYYNQGYYYPSSGMCSYPATTTYYYTPGVVQAGATYYAPTYDRGYAYTDWSGMTNGYSPYYGTTYQTYGYTPYGSYYDSGPYISVSPFSGVTAGVGPYVNTNVASPRQVARWLRRW